MAHELHADRFLQVAQCASEQYPLRGTQWTFLGNSEHITFRVDVHEIEEPDLKNKNQGYSNEGYSRGCYLLRIHKPTWYGVKNHARLIRSELQWLCALRQDRGLLVPQPVHNQQDDWITTVSVEGLKVPRLCTLLQWVPGTCSANPFSVSQLSQLGKLLVQLHQHGAQWTLPHGFVRPEFGKESLCELLEEKQLEGQIAQNQADRFREIIQQLAVCQGWFGLIHADFRSWNILWHAGEARIVDFARCGFGYYLYDIALFLNECCGESANGRPREGREAFLEGYESVWSLPLEDISPLEMFLALDELYPYYRTIPQ